MSESALVSVVIPAYNAEAFLERTLRSVLQQTHKKMEIVIVDDGSTDQTRALVERLTAGDERVRILSVRNGGVARARNTGLAESKGDFVAFLDADDLWHPRKLELQLDALTQGPLRDEAAAVYALSRFIDLEDRVLPSFRSTILSGYCFARHLYVKPVGNGSCLLVHREAAVAVGGYEPRWADRGIGGCEDLDFELKLALHYPLEALGLYLVGYRAYGGNMSSNHQRMAKGALATIDHHIAACPELPEWAKAKARASILEYTLSRLIAGSHWNDVVAEVRLLLRTDPMHGLSFFAERTGGKLRRKLAARGIAKPSPQPGQSSDPGRTFFDYRPEEGVNLAQGHTPRMQRTVARLVALDAQLAPVHMKALPQRLGTFASSN